MQIETDTRKRGRKKKRSLKKEKKKDRYEKKGDVDSCVAERYLINDGVTLTGVRRRTGRRAVG